MVASSPEILCRVDKNRVVTNRPLAGTRRRCAGAERQEEVAPGRRGDVTPLALAASYRPIVAVLTLAPLSRRGKDATEDEALKQDLLADQKERCEHIMLVDLGRNDVGRVAESGTVEVEKLMEVEHYSHVMHISSTVTGTLREDLNCWDALR